jgi:hypothetical protein
LKSERASTIARPALVDRFRFGSEGQHEFRINLSWHGREWYFVNDRLHHTRFSWLPGVRKFQVLGHRIEIRASWNIRRYDLKAYVDSELVNNELFADSNRYIEERIAARLAKQPSARFTWSRITRDTVAWVALSLALFWLFRTMGR